MIEILNGQRAGSVRNHDVHDSSRPEDTLKFPKHLYGTLKVLEEVVGMNASDRSVLIWKWLTVCVPLRVVMRGSTRYQMIARP